MKLFDPKAVKILRSYHPVDEYGKTTPEEFEYAKNAGLMFDKQHMTHDEIMAWAFKEAQKCDQQQVTDAFLLGLAHNLPYYRAALSAYAVMSKYPQHIHTGPSPECPYCKICAMLPEQDVNLSFINRCRWSGSIIARDPDILAFYLHQHNQAQPVPKPAQSDIDLFAILLNAIHDSEPAETPTSLSKRLRRLKITNMSLLDIRYFLDTLGYCGILDTPKHRGFIYQFTSHLNPSKSRSSDWGYPVDFWTGKDGINFDALNYWFGDYGLQIG